MDLEKRNFLDRVVAAESVFVALQERGYVVTCGIAGGNIEDALELESLFYLEPKLENFHRLDETQIKHLVGPTCGRPRNVILVSQEALDHMLQIREFIHDQGFDVLAEEVLYFENQAAHAI